jgi:hypothetical protein
MTMVTNNGERERKRESTLCAAADGRLRFARRAGGCALGVGEGPNVRCEGAHAKFPAMSDLALLAPNAPARIWVAATIMERGRINDQRRRYSREQAL